MKHHGRYRGVVGKGEDSHKIVKNRKLKGIKCFVPLFRIEDRNINFHSSTTLLSNFLFFEPSKRVNL